MRKAKIAMWAWILLGVCAALGQAQTAGQSGKLLLRGLCLLWAKDFDAGHERWRCRWRYIHIQRARRRRRRGNDGRQPGQQNNDLVSRFVLSLPLLSCRPES